MVFPSDWRSVWFSTISGVSKVPRIFQCDTRIDSWSSLVSKGNGSNFLLLIAEFLEDRDRSGKYHVDGTVYAHAALECFRIMVNPNDE